MKDTYLQQFKDKVDKVCPLGSDIWNDFAQRIHYKELAKGKFLTRQGKVESSVYYILDGGVRMYNLYHDREICTSFSFENQFTGSVTSFLRRTPSQYSVQTMFDTCFLEFKHDELYWLYGRYPIINKLGRLVMEQLLVEKRQRELDILLLTGEERYMKLLVEHPIYAMEIPLKHLASYLGLTAASLSRIRNSIINKI